MELEEESRNRSGQRSSARMKGDVRARLGREYEGWKRVMAGRDRRGGAVGRRTSTPPHTAEGSETSL